MTGYEPGKLLKRHRISYNKITPFNMSITTISTRSNGSVKPLRGKENYISWSIEIENVLLQNNNSAYIRNGSRAAQPGTQYLNDYNQQIEQYDLDLKAYNAALTAFEAAGQ